MTRALLVLLLCAVTLALGLCTALVQTDNHERAHALSQLQRECEMLEAANAQAETLVSSHLPGQPNRPLSLRPERSGDIRAARTVRE
jgi:hypothetical protein